jgi:pimeloyl-ACP methyl ester carboxylesterase
MDHVKSKDGATLVYDRLGDGPSVVLVGGGSVDRTANAPLAALLAEGFTVFNYDRRGRGESADGPGEYAIEREFEDLDAVIDAAGGGPVHLYGTSSGAALALLATASGRPVERLALWEPPYIIGDSRERPPADTASIYRDFVTADRRGDAVEYFMTEVVQLPREFVEQARQAPWWPAQEAIAHTLAYDATIMGDYTIPIDQVRSVQIPTVVLDGGASPDWMRMTARTIAETLPVGRHATLEGQQHNVDPTALAPVLKEFFS